MLLGRAQEVTRIETYNSQRTHEKSLTGKKSSQERKSRSYSFQASRVAETTEPSAVSTSHTAVLRLAPCALQVACI